MSDIPKPRLSGVSRRFNRTQALAATNFEISQGEFIDVVGSSGCTKSTLLNIIAGVLALSGGVVALDGCDMIGQFGQVGYMLQMDLLLPWRSVLNKICLGGILHGRLIRAYRAADAVLAERYGLGAFLGPSPAAGDASARGADA